MAILFFLFALFFGSCQKYGILVRQQLVNPTYLASTHIGSPDPRQADPPRGQMVIAEWWVPRELLSDEPKLVLHLIFWNYTEKIMEFPIDRRIGYETISVLGKEFDETKGVLTYMAQIVTNEGKIFREWKHQLWVKLIQIEEEEEATTEEEEID
ncbi:MAG: hypothetical protein L0207_05415 [Chlamydiae bacterium]|nr:hypothetical protein [Chlamydiota bacterium]